MKDDSIMTNKPRTTRSRRASRSGAVATEFAITASVAFLFFFAAFEFSRVAMIRGTVDNAIYEGARVGIIPGATVAEVDRKVRDILGAALVRSANVTVSPNPLLFDTKTITVTADISLDRNTFSPAKFFGGKSIVRSIVLKREAERLQRTKQAIGNWPAWVAQHCGLVEHSCCAIH